MGVQVKKCMTDKKVHSAHSAVEPTDPGAETDAQREPSCHPVCLEETDEENNHARKYIEDRKIINLIFSYPVIDGLTDYNPRPGL